MDKVMTDSSLRSHSYSRKANAKEWRLFMSPRVSDTLSQVATQRSSSMDNEERLHKQEFEKIFKEVEQLGTSQMSWKKRKAIETQKIIALGAKPKKGHKMPIAMGRNIKRKREKLEEQKLQEDMALGLRSAKREKKMVEKPHATNLGLKASEGIFKGGVLYVKPLVTKKAEDEVREGKYHAGKGKGKSHRKNKKGKHKGRGKRR